MNKSFVTSIPSQINLALECWLTAPEVNAAGRLGLFRIVFGVYSLWHVSRMYIVEFAQFPELRWRPVDILSGLRQPPSLLFMQWLEFAFVACLVVLIIGYRVRLVTVLVFIGGMLVEGFRLSFGRIEHSSIFIAFHIPLFMLMSEWGATYSLDAVLRQRRGKPVVSPSDASLRHVLPIRAILCVLCLLFFSAAYSKWALSPWVTNPEVFANLMLRENVEVTSKGYNASPLLPLLAGIPIIYGALRFMTLFFELGFPLSLVSVKLRNWFVSVALIFHTINAWFFYVTFTPILITYGVFVDWQSLYERWLPERLKRLRAPDTPAWRLEAGTLAIAVIVAVLYTQTRLVRSALTLGDWLDWQTIWLVLLPFAFYGLVKSSLALVKPLLAVRRAQEHPVTE